MKPNEALEMVLEILRRAPVTRAEAFALQQAIGVLANATAPKEQPKP